MSYSAVSQTISPLIGLAERIDSGLSQKIIFSIDSLSPTETDWYLITQRGDKPCIEANSYLSAATGLNHYLKYVAGTHVSWNNPTAELPGVLPAVTDTIRCETPLHHRYYLNYCTHSYSMAFWDWQRWQQEIDFMALHGLNMPLVTTGTEAVWRNTLRRLDYPEDKIDAFIAGPGYQAWWLMNNLEGWGGPNTDEYYHRNIDLATHILSQMRQWGMQPVLPGYSGMMPHDAYTTLGIDVTDQGKWLGYTRPAFLQPVSEDFNHIAEIYYTEQERLFGKAPFYSMDPFHEGGSVEGINLEASGKAIYDAMKHHSPDATWIIQAWQENPRQKLLASIPSDSLIILDLQSENASIMPKRHNSLQHRSWLFCMLHNFGGNIGLYGKMQALIDNYHAMADTIPGMTGIGLTMEGIDTNPAVYELICEMPWRNITDKTDWITDYAKARYGTANNSATEAWRILASSVYDCPADSIQQGTCESLFCARPSDHPHTASTWANSKRYYDYGDVRRAAKLMLNAADSLSDNPNFRYDLVDIIRQTVADRGRETIDSLYLAYQSKDSAASIGLLTDL
ncbi:MAG: alpha-N-acetylglucosaminidase [Paramuribaculum sp.]|nr:alpha-N-acetylglucosaminidase [Paramuribaculum sp.]